MGGVLNKRKIPLATGIKLYMVGSVATIGGTIWLSSYIGITERIFEYFSISVLIMCVGIFIIGKNVGEKIHSPRIKSILADLSRQTRGIYFVHMIVVTLTGFSDKIIYAFPLFTIPMVVLLNWFLSLILTWLFGRGIKVASAWLRENLCSRADKT